MLGHRVSRCGVYGSGLRAEGFEFRDLSSFGVYGSGFNLRTPSQPGPRENLSPTLGEGVQIYTMPLYKGIPALKYS